ncbi:MAG: hypothetical protein ABIJ40_17960 [Bacteroidota bacterium]
MKHRVIVLIYAVILLLCFIIVSGVYNFFIKDTRTSYSITTKWKEYFSLDDWNIASHATVDLDNDGIDDIVTFTGCSFLSSLPADKIPKQQQCKEPEMSLIVFPNEEKVGQLIIRPTHNWLFKNFLVLTANNKWQYYAYDGFKLVKMQFNADRLFEVIQPSLADYFDLYWYQLTHVGVILLLIILSPRI